MKKILVIAALLAAATTQSFAQVRSQSSDPDPFIQHQLDRDAQWHKGGY